MAFYLLHHFFLTSGLIESSETVNLLTDMTWSNPLSFNSSNHLYGGIDINVICETLHYEFATSLLLSKAKADSSLVCIFVLGSDTTNGVGIICRWATNNNVSFKISSMTANPDGVNNLDFKVRYRYYKN